MNTSSGEPCVSICCELGNTAYHPGTRCYWNVSFSSEETVLPKMFDPTWAWIKKFKPSDLHPRNMTPCLNDTVCYSDCMSGKNISTYLFGNGMISMNDLTDGGLTCRLDAEDYCFKSYETDETKNVTLVCKTFFELITNMKLSSEEILYAYIGRSLYLYVMSISLPFLVATFFIYTIIPELKNLHGLLLRSYITCCFVYFLTLIIIASDFEWALNIFMMILFYVALYETYFWLNVMCFDIWWTFRSLNECSNQSPRKKYIFYSIYAWGIPLLIIAVKLILIFDPENIIKVNDELSRPGYVNSLPPTILVASNVCFFVLTIINITQQKKATAQCLDGSESRRYNEEKKRFYLYLKLFIVMGMTFISEVLPFVAPFPVPKYIFFVLALPNYMQGPIIFVLFVWNDRTKRLLAKHLGLKDWVTIQWIERAAVRIRTLVQRPQTS